MTDSTGQVLRMGATTVSKVARLENFLESKYLSQGENTRMGEDTTDLKSFTAAATRQPFSISAKPGQEKPTGATEPRLWRLQCFRSKGVLGDGAHMRLYFLQAPEFPLGWREAVARRSTKLEEIADPRCIANTEPDLLDMYASVVADLADPSRLAPSIRTRLIKDVAVGEDSDVAIGLEVGSEVDAVLLVIGHRAGTTHSYFTGTPLVYRWYGMYAVSKHVEVLANGVVIFAFKLRSLDLSRAAAAVTATPVSGGMGASGWGGPAVPSMSLDLGAPAHVRVTSSGPAIAAASAGGSDSARLAFDRRSVYTVGGASAPSLEARVADMVRDVALHFVLPRTSITPLLDKGALSAQEAAYAYCAWKFAFTFLARSSSDLSRLAAIIKTEIGRAHV